MIGRASGRIVLLVAVAATIGCDRVDPATNSMVNVSVWESLAAAQQMDSLKEMLGQRDVFVALGVRFQPIRNYTGLWSITP